MSFRYEQSVSWGLRVNIEKGQEFVVLIDNMSGYFFFYDFAEDAVRHGKILPQLAHEHICFENEEAQKKCCNTFS
jgi:hypothetical protein